MEPFKTQVEPPQTQETVAPKPVELISNELEGYEVKAQDAPISDLTVWEGENRKKYVNEYFDTHDFADEFEWKMPVSKIDKYIKELMAEREYELSTENYREILEEIEGEIGSKNLMLYKRIQKIASYAQVMKKLSEAKKAKERFLSF